MKKLCLSLFVLLLSMALYSEEKMLSEIKKIDSQMYQGTLKFTEDYLKYSNDLTVSEMASRTITIIHDKEGRYKFENADNKKVDVSEDFFDGKDYVAKHTHSDYLYVSDTPSLFFSDRYSPNIIKLSPSMRYGRGLTELKHVSVNESNNTLTGYTPLGSKTIAYLDPNLGYAAYRIERYGGDREYPISVIENSKPILVDGKYYIYSESLFYINFDNIPSDKNFIKILYASFSAPDEKNYIFKDWIKSDRDLIDERVKGREVFHKRSTLPKNITSEKLYEITKEKAKNFYNKNFSEDKKSNSTYRNKIILIILISVILILLACFVMKKMKKNE